MSWSRPFYRLVTYWPSGRQIAEVYPAEGREKRMSLPALLDKIERGAVRPNGYYLDSMTYGIVVRGETYSFRDYEEVPS